MRVIRRLSVSILLILVFCFISINPLFAFGQGGIEEPTGLRIVSSSDNSLTLTWNPVENARNYQVYYKYAKQDEDWYHATYADNTSVTINFIPEGEILWSVEAVSQYDYNENKYHQSGCGTYTVSTIKVPSASYNNAYLYNNGEVSYSFYSKDNVDGVEIFRSKDGGVWTNVATISSTQFNKDSYYQNWRDKLTESGLYRYKYRFYIKDKKGSFSSIVPENYSLEFLEKPIITSVSGLDNAISITWKPVKGATGYEARVYNKDGYYIAEQTFGEKATSGKIIVQNLYYLDKSSTHILYLTAINENVYSERSEAQVFISTPLVLRSSNNTTANQIHLAWTISKGVQGFQLDKYDAKTKSWMRLKNITGDNVKDYIDKNLTANTEYQYRIRSIKDIDGNYFYSSWSPTLTVCTHPSAKSISAKNSDISAGMVARISQAVSETKAFLYASGYTGGTWANTSDISSFIDYKGYYTYAYPYNNKIYINRVNPSDLKTKKTIKINQDYPLLGGVIGDSKGNYYIAWGQSDTNEKKSVKTFAVSKYDYNGKLKGTISVKGGDINVKTPFDAGNCAMTFDGDILVCHFARLMYKSSDGLNHQASQIFAVNTNTMKQASGYNNYASHSFDQRIISTKNGGILLADLGDAYPRGIQTSVINNKDISRTTLAIHFNGNTGDNYINAQLGDISEVSSGYVISGSSCKTNNSLDGPKQLFITFLSKDTLEPVINGETRTVTIDKEKVKDNGIIWLTNNKSDQVANPQLFAIEKDKFVVFWQRYNVKSGNLVDTYYAVISANGKVLQKATSMNGVTLNGNEEVSYKDGYAYWTSSIHKYDGYWDFNKNTYIDTSKSYITTHKLKIGALKAGVRRLYGDNRYGTSSAITKAYLKDTNKSKLSNVIVVNGKDSSFADALSATYLSAKYSSPILLTDLSAGRNNEIVKWVKNNMDIKSGKVFFVGGNLVLPKSLKKQFNKAGIKVNIIAGPDRIGTNIAVLNKVGVKKGSEVLVTDGWDPYTSLIASATGKPVLLVQKSKLTKEQKEFLSNKNCKFTIIGNNKRVSKQIASDLSNYGSVNRVNEGNLDTLSVKVAQKYWPKGPSQVFLARSETTFADALSGGPECILFKGPLLLVSNKDFAQTKQYVKDTSTIKRITVFGGSLAISDKTVKSIAG